MMDELDKMSLKELRDAVRKCRKESMPPVSKMRKTKLAAELAGVHNLLKKEVNVDLSKKPEPVAEKPKKKMEALVAEKKVAKKDKAVQVDLPVLASPAKKKSVSVGTEARETREMSTQTPADKRLAALEKARAVKAEKKKAMMEDV